LISIPADADVSSFGHRLPILIDVLKYQDPLHVLLEYIAEVNIFQSSRVYHACNLVLQNAEQNCDLALVHDDDLEFIKNRVSYFRIVALSFTRVVARNSAGARQTEINPRYECAQNSPGSVWSVFSRIHDFMGPVLMEFQFHRTFTWQQQWVRS
jgi:hypothetical protein